MSPYAYDLLKGGEQRGINLLAGGEQKGPELLSFAPRRSLEGAHACSVSGDPRAESETERLAA